MSSLRSASLAPALLALSTSAVALAQEDGVAHGDAPAAADELSGESREALARLEVGEGLAARLVASEPLLQNPVAFAIDVLGRFYVVETDRVHHGVTDMRSHMDWLDEDLAIETVEDRVEMYRRHTDPERFIEDYGTAEDRIVRLVDTDGDGVLDEKTLFAGGFNDPADGIAAGVLPTVRADGSVEVWFTCIPSLYRMLDVDGDGVADDVEEHSTGYGLRVALLGHDMHGLVVGPDGRLYFSIGDRGFNVMTPEGRHLVRYGEGAVFRCELDGSNLELYCTGLRNPQELAFDDAGNLFTLDNNSDAKDQARWTFLMEGSDSGWRQAFQWIQHPVARGPWVGERIWEPRNDEQPAYITPPIANITNGPSGLVAYPGTGWTPEYDGSFFVCDFRGNPGYSGIWAVWNEPDGAGFAVERTEKPVWNCLPTDVTFGPDGDLYWTDWISGWNGPGKGRVFGLAPEARSEAAIEVAAGTRELLTRDVTALDAGDLYLLLGDVDRRVRLRAQFELARRLLDEAEGAVTLEAMIGAQSEGLLERLDRPEFWTLARYGDAGDGVRMQAYLTNHRIHLSWLQAQVARVGAAEGVAADRLGPIVTRLEMLLNALFPGVPTPARRRSAEVDTALALLEAGAGTGQALVLRSAVERRIAHLGRATTTLPAPDAADSHRLREEVMAWGRLAEATADPDPAHVIQLLSTNACDGDPWIRHACVRALERLGDPAIGVQLLGNGEEEARVAGVVLLRRLGDAQVAGALSDESPRVRAEAARAIYDANIGGAMGALAGHLATDLEDENDWTVRRAIHANRAVGDAAAATRLVAYAADPDRPTPLRAESLRVLARWCEAETRDGIVRDHRPLAAGARADVDAAALLTADFARRAPAEGGRRLARPLLDLHAAFGSEAAPLVALARNEALPVPLRQGALSAAVARFGGAPETTALVEALLDDPDPADRPLRMVALGTLPAEEAAGRLFAAATAEGSDASRRREAVRVLGAQDTVEAAAALAELAHRFGPAEPALVEWFEAARGDAMKDAEPVAAALRSVEQRFDDAAEQDPLAPYRMCLEGGDAEAGLQIFLAKSETSCTRCHAWEGEGGSEAGPKLLGVGDRLTREQILRSIVTPDAEIADGYQQWILALHDGEIWSGRIVEETDDLVALETKDPETDGLAVFEFGTDEIARRRRDVSAMPADLVTFLSRRELRDLVAFLASLRD